MKGDCACPPAPTGGHCQLVPTFEGGCAELGVQIVALPIYTCLECRPSTFPGVRGPGAPSWGQLCPAGLPAALPAVPLGFRQSCSGPKPTPPFLGLGPTARVTAGAFSAALMGGSPGSPHPGQLLPGTDWLKWPPEGQKPGLAHSGLPISELHSGSFLLKSGVGMTCASEVAPHGVPSPGSAPRPSVVKGDDLGGVSGPGQLC